MSECEEGTGGVVVLLRLVPVMSSTLRMAVMWVRTKEGKERTIKEKNKKQSDRKVGTRCQE